MQTVLEDTHVLKENVDCIAVYQNIATPISTVTGNIWVHIMPKSHTYAYKFWKVQEIDIEDDVYAVYWDNKKIYICIYEIS